MMADDWYVHTEPVKVYLCDQMKPCVSSPICGTYCKHTKDFNHAKNRDHSDDMKFETVPTGDKWEVEVE